MEQVCFPVDLSSTPRSSNDEDKYPVTEGHLLIIPNRHVANDFSVTEEEKTALWAMLHEGKKLSEERFKSNGYNVGINVGTPPDRQLLTATFISFPGNQGQRQSIRGR